MWWWIAAFVVSLVATYFLMPKPEIAEVPEVQEVDIPTVEDGKTIPVLFGTRDTEAFNVVWWGDVSAREFKVSGGDSTWYMDVEDVHGGYWYFLGLHAVLFHGPIDSITMVKSDDKIAWSGESAGGIICDIGSKDFYGDKKKEGGFGARVADGDSQSWPSDGCLEILMGYPDQARNWYLEHNLDGGDAVGDTGAHEVPAFRGVVSAVFNRFYIGNSPQLRKILFRGQRIHVQQDGVAQWYDELAAIPAYCEEQIEPVTDYAVFIAMDRGLTTSTTAQWRQEQGVEGFIQKYIGNTEHFEQFTPSVGYGFFHSYREATYPSGAGTDCNVVCPSDPGYTASIPWTEVHGLNATDSSELPNYESIPPTFGTGSDYNAAIDAAEQFFDSCDEGIPKYLFIISDGVLNPWACWYVNPNTGGSIPIWEWVPCPDLALSTSYSARARIETLISEQGIEVSGFVNGYLGDSTYLKIVTEEDILPVFTDSAEELTNALWTKLESKISPSSSGNYFDMNPAHIIRECITDPDWGEGGAETLPDESAFTYAADTLYAEGMGISIKWTAQTSIDDFIDLIKKHINAELYTDHATGKKILKLIRDDYVVADLDTYGEDEIVKVENAKRPMIGELINSVTVQYWDSCTGEDASVTVQDQALVSLQGGQVNTTIQYPGFTNMAIATRAATRDLRALASQLLTCTIYVNRSAENLNLGSVFVFYWPDLEIDGIVMRVQGIDFGDGRSNTIKLDVIEDVFGLPATVVVDDDDNDPVWTNPSQPPVPVDYQLAIEAPYFELVRRLGESDTSSALANTPTLGYVTAAAARSGNAINATVAIDDGSGYLYAGPLNFCGTLTIAAAVDQQEKEWEYDSSVDPTLMVIGSYGQIDEEFVRIDAIDTTLNKITVGRAVLDSCPREHAIGARLYGLGAQQKMHSVEYIDGDSVNTKIRPTTSLGTLDNANASALNVVMDSRAIRPYPPANFNINGFDYPSTLIGDDFTAAWVHRDRLQQISDILLDHKDASIGPEAGTTYRLQIINGSTIEDEYAAISGLSQTVDTSLLSNQEYELRLYSEKNSILSQQFVKWLFTFSSAPVFIGTIVDFETRVDADFFYDASVHFTTADAGKTYNIQNAPSWMEVSSAGVLSGIPTTSATINGVTVTCTKGSDYAVSNTFSVTIGASLVGAHLYWRLYMTAENSTSIRAHEIEMRGSVGGADQCSGGTAVSSAPHASYPASYAFDNNETTRCEIFSAMPQWIKYEFASEVSVLEFSFNCQNPATYTPKDFKLQYSDNDIDWTTTCSITGKTDWETYTTHVFGVVPAFSGNIHNLEAAIDVLFQYDMSVHFEPSGGDVIAYTLNNAPAWLSIGVNGVMSGTPTSESTVTGVSVTYRTINGTATTNTFNIEAVTGNGKHLYWRLYIAEDTGSGRVRVPELEVRATISGADQCAGGAALASSTYGSTNVAARAFDNNTSTYWEANSMPEWIGYKFSSIVGAAEFTIVGANSTLYNPEDFTFDYSDDGINWATVHSVLDKNDWVVGQIEYFVV